MRLITPKEIYGYGRKFFRQVVDPRRRVFYTAGEGNFFQHLGALMEKNVHMYRLEEQTGKDIRQVIQEAVQRGGTVTAAAAELNLSRERLQLWIKQLDGSVRVRPRSEVKFEGWAPGETEGRELAEAR